jgi:hypothetical protein
MSYPSDFENRYRNLVASGQRPQVRQFFQHPADSGKWFELFYDVYLTEYLPSAPKNKYIYEYVYWMTEVRLSTKGGTSTPVGGPRLLQSSWTTSANVLSSGTILSELKVYGTTKSIPSNLLFMQTNNADRALAFAYSALMPRSTNVNTSPTQTSPSDFGWVPKVKSNTGNPKEGPGGTPYWSIKSTADQPTPEPVPTTPGTLPGEDAPPDAGDIGFTFPKKRSLRFNPPLISTASGAYVGVNVDGVFDDRAPGTRQAIIGSGTDYQRFMRKGTIQQYIVNEEAWKVSGQGGSVTTKYNKKDKPVKTDSWAVGDSVLDPKIRYGFRFHYNPAELSFASQNIDGVDPAVIMSGLDKAMPVAADGASIGLTLYLNRIEDMSFLEKRASGMYFQWKDLYAGRKVGADDLKELAERGTGYDLEFLYRAALGRPYKTALRGTTADLGVIVGLPLMLNLGKRMRFVGRLGSLSYVHTSFTQNMVPMFTTVSMTFTRVPDAAQFSQ